MGDDELWRALAATGLAVAVVQSARLWWRAWLPGWRLGRRTRRALVGERRAEALLCQRGYTIDARQLTQVWTVEVDGGPVAVALRADYLVTRGGRRWVADVKTGDAAPQIESAATRRQLLEYRCAFAVDGVLLVDVDAGAVREVVFALPAAPRPRRLGWALALFCVGLLVGLVMRGELLRRVRAAAARVGHRDRNRR